MIKGKTTLQKVVIAAIIELPFVCLWFEPYVAYLKILTAQIREEIYLSFVYRNCLRKNSKDEKEVPAKLGTVEWSVHSQWNQSE